VRFGTLWRRPSFARFSFSILPTRPLAKHGLGYRIFVPILPTEAAFTHQFSTDCSGDAPLWNQRPREGSKSLLSLTISEVGAFLAARETNLESNACFGTCRFVNWR
jgi:hypothetical protein